MSDVHERLRAALADRYRLDRELGAGGMATVYLAHDLKHDRPVALKVLRPELAASLGGERFLREIRVTAKLNHPHILPLLDSGEEGGFLFYVMPYMEGESLRERLERERQLPLDEALTLTLQVASALDCAHQQGIVHRDIKPENILLSRGEAVVADFGIALAVRAAGGERLTETGLSLGTPQYMSPEQATGSREVDARSDVYSLGAVLYEMLVGEPPHTGPTTEVVLAKLLTQAAVPNVIRPAIPERVSQAVLKALAKQPVDRFGTVRAFVEALAADATGAESVKKSIVVLPFANLSPDPENEYFVDGLTEEIITDLPQVRSLLVISRNSAMQLKHTTKGTREIGRELNVRYVLEGSVRRAGNNLRITAQLIDGATDAHLWAEKYAGTLDDVFDLQEQLSRRIVDGLRLSLTPEEDRRLAQRPMSDIGAHDIWLRARQSALTLTPEGLDRARGLVEQALAIVDDNALLHATLSWVHALRYSGLVEGADDALRLVGHHAARALELDPNLAWSLFAMSVFHLRRGDLPNFVRFATRALEVERDSHTLAVLGLNLASAGRLEVARRYAAEAAARDPLTWVTSFAEAHVDTQAGLAGAAFERLRDSVRRLARGDPWPTFELGYAALQADHETEALGWFRDVATTDAPVYSSLSRLFIPALESDRAAVANVLETSELRHLAPRDGRTSCQVASCLAHVGETDQAFTWLERGIERWFTNHRFLSEFDRWLVPLRGDLRFEALLERARKKERAFEV